MSTEDYVHVPSMEHQDLANPPSGTFAVQMGISSRLYNNDLAPTTRKGRHWSGYSIFTLWANDVHSLGNYAFAIGLFSLGLSGGAILGALAFGLLPAHRAHRGAPRRRPRRRRDADGAAPRPARASLRRTLNRITSGIHRSSDS